MRLFDTHCHLQDDKAFPDPTGALQAAHAAGVDRVVVVGTDPEDWTRAIALAEVHERVYAILGWHPNYTADYDSASLAGLRELLRHEKVLALGEIGLDYHWSYSRREQQFAALREQLDLAAELSIPVVFHAREAYGDLLDVLESRPPQAYLFHCWAGDAEAARRAVALGAYFGVDGPVTYKKADDLRAVLVDLPKERLVVETDSPYMAPVPHRGKPNQPAFVAHVNAGLAAVLGLNEDECAELTTSNAERFFRL